MKRTNGSSSELDSIVELSSVESKTSAQSHESRKWSTVYEASVLKDHSRSGRGQAIASGFNTVRHPGLGFFEHFFDPSFIWFLRSDWFHLVVEMRTGKILIFLALIYVSAIFFFSLWWYAMAISPGDPCETGIENFTDAFYFSTITFTTIGYGASSVFFGSCASVPALVVCESFTGLLIHSLAMGIIFSKTQRGNTRGYSISYSKKCLLRMIKGEPHIIFRVCEARKLQLIEAHVRLYAILNEEDPLTGEYGIGSHQMRINQPDDEMGGMLLLMLPSKVVHRIDAWSPLLPPSLRPKGSAMQTYTFPDVRLRAADAEQGNRTGVECSVTGEGFGTEWAHRLHHERENMQYPCEGSPVVGKYSDGSSNQSNAAISDAVRLELLKTHFLDSNIEILVVVEGIDPTCSTTLQSCYSYKTPDILFDTHDYVECTERDSETGQIKIDFIKFQETKRIVRKRVSTAGSTASGTGTGTGTGTPSRNGAGAGKEGSMEGSPRRMSPSVPADAPLLSSTSSSDGGASGVSASAASGGGGGGGASSLLKSHLSVVTLLGVVLSLILPTTTTAAAAAAAATSKGVYSGARVGEYTLSPIGCGTWSWGNRLLWDYSPSDDEGIRECYNYVTSNGVNWFDTADSYGTGALNGRAEELLGMFERETRGGQQGQGQSMGLFGSGSSGRGRGKGEAPVIATKLAPYPWRLGSESMVAAADASVDRLGRPIDMVQLHWPPSLGWQETAYLEGFGRILSEGMATQVGLSNCGPKKLREINAYAREKCERPYSVASNQVQFSLLSRYPIETELLEIAREEGVQLIGYSALGLGLLGDKYSLESNYLPSGLRGALFREFLPIMTPLLSELRAIAKSRGKTVAQVALNWSLAKGLLVLVGMRTVAQARENLGAVGWRLSAAEVECLDKAASRVPKQLVQNSFQSR